MQRRGIWLIPLLALLAGLLAFLLRRNQPGPEPDRVSTPPSVALLPVPPSPGTSPAPPTTIPPDAKHGSLRVQVMANGLPLKDADVTVMKKEAGSALRFRSTASGMRSILQIPPGAYSVGAQHADFLGAESSILIGAGMESVVRLDLQPGGHMSGRVTDVAGNPLPDTLVLLVDGRSKIAISNHLSTRTGADGRYVMPAIPRGHYGMRFRNERFKLKDRFEFFYLTGTERYEVDIQLEVGVMAGGRTVDEKGQPLAGVDLRIDAKDSIAFAVSDARGLWEGHGLYEGPLAVTAKKPGYGTAVLRGIPADTRNLEIRLERGGRLSGRVEAEGLTDAFTVLVSRFEPDLDRSIRMDSRVFDPQPEAVFELDNLAPGIYELDVEADGYEPLERPRVTLSAGAAVGDIRIRLKRK